MLLIWLGDHDGGAVVRSKGWPGDLSVRRKYTRPPHKDERADIRRDLAEAAAQAAIAELNRQYMAADITREEMIRQALMALDRAQAAQAIGNALAQAALMELDDEEAVEMLLLHS